MKPRSFKAVRAEFRKVGAKFGVRPEFRGAAVRAFNSLFGGSDGKGKTLPAR
jgi:hypothetical protein